MELHSLQCGAIGQRNFRRQRVALLFERRPAAAPHRQLFSARSRARRGDQRRRQAHIGDKLARRTVAAKAERNATARAHESSPIRRRFLDRRSFVHSAQSMYYFEPIGGKIYVKRFYNGKIRYVYDRRARGENF